MIANKNLLPTIFLFSLIKSLLNFLNLLSGETTEPTIKYY